MVSLDLYKTKIFNFIDVIVAILILIYYYTDDIKNIFIIVSFMVFISFIYVKFYINKTNETIKKYRRPISQISTGTSLKPKRPISQISTGTSLKPKRPLVNVVHATDEEKNIADDLLKKLFE